MPWADRLYVLSYLTSGTKADHRDGFLYAVSSDLSYKIQIEHHHTCYANRMIHYPSRQLVIGKWVIDETGTNVREFQNLKADVRLGGSAEHLIHPDTMVYLLSMDGPLFECDVVSTMVCHQVANLNQELKIPNGHQPHFMAAHTMNGKLYVASNTFDQRDEVLSSLKNNNKDAGAGRLAQWDGITNSSWEVLEKTAFVEIAGRRNFGKVVYSIGWDSASVLLKVSSSDTGKPNDPSSFSWKTYRLPKASHAFDHLWQTEWPRLREIATERYLLDAHGMFYELSPLAW